MEFYKVKRNFDGWDLDKGLSLIANELFTLNERVKHNIAIEYFDIVNISKFKTYWLFGARFECKLKQSFKPIYIRFKTLLYIFGILVCFNRNKP